MALHSEDGIREEKIEYLVNLMLAAHGWPEGNDLNEYYLRAERIYECGGLGMDLGFPASNDILAPLTATTRPR